MILLYTVAALYVLWIFYLASMALIRARDAGNITRPALVLGYPIVGLAVAIDIALNLTVFTALFLELPRERMITHRLRRHIDDAGWRGRLARWFAHNLLDTFDPSGRHV